MKRRGSIFLPTVFMLIFILVIYKIDDITDYIIKIINSTPEVVLPESNKYARNNSFEYVQKTDTFTPYSKQDIINIFYSYLDNGYDNLTFYCPEEYENCVNDLTDMVNNQTVITDIGNFVHPYNNFHDVYLTTSSSGEVNLKINRTYTDEEIEKIDKKIDEIMADIFKDKTELKDKILAAHDYIVDNTSYDDDGESDTNAYDLLFTNKTKCFGYADTMAIILDKLGVKSTLLTGDNRNAAEHIAYDVGIEDLKYNCLPEDKISKIKEFQSNDRKVAMIGDGINDAPALRQADIGISMGGVGSDISIEASDVCLVSDDIKYIPHLLALSRKTIRTINIGIAFALGLNIIATILAALGYLGPIGGAFVHNIGSVIVIIYSSLLLRFKTRVD